MGVVKGNADKWWAAEQQWLVVQKDINAVIDAAHQSNPNITQQEINDAIRAHIQSKAPDLLSKDPADTEAKIKDMTIVFVKKYCMDANTQKSWQDIQDLVSKRLAKMPKEAIQMLNEADYQKIVQDVVQKHNPVLADLGSGSIVALGQEMMKSIAQSAAHDGSIQSELFEGAGRSIDYLGQLYQDAAKTQLMLTGAVDTFQKDNPGMIPRMPSIKGIARATEKVNAEKGESYKELRDLSRGTIEVTKLTDLVPSVHKFLDTIGKKYPGSVLRRFKNKFKDPAKSGYADIQIHVEVGGHMCEMQFQCTTMLDFKEMGAYPGRAGHKDSGKTVAWADWSILLNGTDKLMVATNTIPKLELIGKKITIPGDAKKSIDKFKKGAGDKDWFVSSHDTYNVSRWLSENKTNALLSKEEQKSLPDLATVWSNLEKEATTAVKAIVGKEMLGDASGDPGEAYTAQEKAIGEFDLPVPKFL